MLLQMLRVSCITFFPPKINSLHRYSALVAPLHSCIGITCTKIPPFSFEQNHFLHRMFQEELTIDDAPNPLEHFPMQEFDAMVVRFLKLMPCFPLPPDLWDIVGEYLDTAKTLDVMTGECVYINLFQRSNRIQNRILIVFVESPPDITNLEVTADGSFIYEVTLPVVLTLRSLLDWEGNSVFPPAHPEYEQKICAGYADWHDCISASMRQAFYRSAWNFWGHMAFHSGEQTMHSMRYTLRLVEKRGVLSWDFANVCGNDALTVLLQTQIYNLQGDLDRVIQNDPPGMRILLSEMGYHPQEFIRISHLDPDVDDPELLESDDEMVIHPLEIDIDDEEDERVLFLEEDF